MSLASVLLSSVAAVALFLIAGATWVLSLPSTSADAVAPSIAKEEADGIIAALKPPKRVRPLIAIIGINDATETTDYLMPYGILRRADIADVYLLSFSGGKRFRFIARVERQKRHPEHARQRKHAPVNHTPLHRWKIQPPSLQRARIFR